MRINMRLSRLMIIVWGVVVSFVFSFWIAKYVSETYFFDQFVYQKKTEYGYWSQAHQQIDYSVFGERAADVLALKRRTDGSLYTNQMANQPALPDVLGKSTDDENFRVAIIGDSYVWGTGIKNQERMSHLLTNRLNYIRKTEVLSFSYPGSSILDYYLMYKDINKIYKIDLYIFVLVDNDALINDPNDYNYRTRFTMDMVNECTSKTRGSVEYSFLWNNDFTSEENLKGSESRTTYWESPANECIVDSAVKRLPSERAIYFITDDYIGKSDKWKKYKDILNNNSVKYLDSIIGSQDKRYSKYWSGNPFSIFEVSEKEMHPNALANKMYADLLYDEIVKNPKYSFVPENSQ